MAGEFKISDLILVSQKSDPEGAGVGQKILLKSFFARADVGQCPAFLIGQRNNGPFIEDGLLIARVHLRRASLNVLFCLVQSHKTCQLCAFSKASSKPWNKNIKRRA